MTREASLNGLVLNADLFGCRALLVQHVPALGLVTEPLSVLTESFTSETKGTDVRHPSFLGEKEVLRGSTWHRGNDTLARLNYPQCHPLVTASGDEQPK
jgi:hypothetical protein